MVEETGVLVDSQADQLPLLDGTTGLVVEEEATGVLEDQTPQLEEAEETTEELVLFTGAVVVVLTLEEVQASQLEEPAAEVVLLTGTVVVVVLWTVVVVVATVVLEELHCSQSLPTAAAETAPAKAATAANDFILIVRGCLFLLKNDCGEC